MEKMLCWLLVLCVIAILPVAAESAFEMRPLVGESSDYSLAENWIQVPAVTKPVDTLYIYPTVSINPISWTRDETLAPAGDNLGSRLLYRSDGLYRDTFPGLADAQLDNARGVVICTAMPDRYIALEADLPNPFGTASLHGVDYDAYYYNIQENVRTRIDAFMAKNAG